MITSSTVRPARRRVVRRSRGALGAAYDVALADFDPELRPAIIAYANAKRDEYNARQALSTEMNRHGVKWRAVDEVARSLVYGTAV